MVTKSHYFGGHSMHYNRLSLLSIWVDPDMLQVIEDAVHKHVEDALRVHIMDLENISDRLCQREGTIKDLAEVVKKMDAMSSEFKNVMSSTGKVIEEIHYKKPRLKETNDAIRIPL